jgi:hypothetical protein
MEQPKSVKAIGIVCTVFGLAALLRLGADVSILRQAEDSPEFAAIAQSIRVFVIISAVVLPLKVAAGIGLWLFRPWAWWLGLVYALTDITGVTIITWFEIAARSDPAALDAQEGVPIPPFSWGGKIVALIIPSVTLLVLLQSHARQAFQSLRQQS